MAQLVEILEGPWSENSIHGPPSSCSYELNLYDRSAQLKDQRKAIRENHKLHRNASNIVSNIASSFQFNDRNSIESALRDALCSFRFNCDVDQDPPLQRRHLMEQLYFSSLPVQFWDEIELDQEINTIEEEIARLQEQKLQLKSSTLVEQTDSECDSSPNGSNESDSDDDDISDDSEDDFDDFEDEYLPPLAALKQLRKKKLLKRKLEDDRENRSKRPYKKSSLDYELQLSISQTITNFELSSSVTESSVSTTSTATTTCPIISTMSTTTQSTTATMSPTKREKTTIIQKEKTFQTEEVLKIKPVVCNEDEDVDILN